MKARKSRMTWSSIFTTLEASRRLPKAEENYSKNKTTNSSSKAWIWKSLNRRTIWTFSTNEANLDHGPAHQSLENSKASSPTTSSAKLIQISWRKKNLESQAGRKWGGRGRWNAVMIFNIKRKSTPPATEVPSKRTYPWLKNRLQIWARSSKRTPPNEETSAPLNNTDLILILSMLIAASTQSAPWPTESSPNSATSADSETHS